MVEDEKGRPGEGVGIRGSMVSTCEERFVRRGNNGG